MEWKEYTCTIWDFEFRAFVLVLCGGPKQLPKHSFHALIILIYRDCLQSLFSVSVPILHYPSNLLLTVPRWYFFRGSSMLHLFMSIYIWSSVLWSPE